MQLTALDGAPVKINGDSVTRLANGLRGRLLFPGTAEYDDSRRIWNLLIDRRPGLIIRCAHRDDITAAVRFAHDRQILLSIRAGGHNHAGFAACNGGLMLDLSLMRRVEVDADASIADVEGGATFAEFDAATHTAGLASTGAIVSMVGVAGYTLGGGIGWLQRKTGLGCDNLVSAEVVTASGAVLKASDTENSGLFWALRGGGGNFGVVSKFRFGLHPLRQVLAGIVFHPLEDLHRVGKLVREVNLSAPEELTVWMLLRRAPATPALPENLHGRPVAGIAICYAGDIEEGGRVIRPLRETGRPLIDLVRTRLYPDWQRSFDPLWGDGYRNEWMGHYLADLSDAALSTLLEFVIRVPSPDTDVKVAHLGGAVARMGEDDTAFGFRESRYALVIQARWKDPAADAVNLEWTRDFFEAMKKHGTGKVYVNFLANEGQARVADAYNSATLRRLRAVKATYDPSNLFRMNQNIAPLAFDPAPL